MDTSASKTSAPPKGENPVPLRRRGPAPANSSQKRRRRQQHGQHDRQAATITSLALLHRIFFLYIEPASTIVGAFYAYVLPRTYLALTHAGSSPSPSSPVPLATGVALAQLANLYVLFALNEGLVLRCTRDLRVWRTLLFGLLVADLGHLYSVSPLGWSQYWTVWRWNAMDAGNIGFVYVGALMRVCFLLGVGVRVSVPGATAADVDGDDE